LRAASSSTTTGREPFGSLPVVSWRVGAPPPQNAGVDHYEVIEGVQFEWDTSKDIANVRKHQISFIEATHAFFDPYAMGGDATVNDEERAFVLGMNGYLRILLVMHTERGPRIRIISARPATRHEERIYEQHRNRSRRR
jgi:uncharacterized DUF497 family protein